MAATKGWLIWQSAEFPQGIHTLDGWMEMLGAKLVGWTGASRLDVYIVSTRTQSNSS